MKKLLCILLSLSVLFCVPVSATAEEPDALRFTDGEFTILHITDPQDDRYAAYDLVNFVKLAISEFSPDLIVMTGDIVEDNRIGDLGIDGESFREGVETNDYNETLENVRVATENFFSIIEEAGIPFAVAQGNNDYNSGVTNEDWLEIYSSYEHSLTTDMSNDADGKIDYNLEILGSDGKTAFNIWMMDNGSGLSTEQIAWYESQSNELAQANGGNPVPSFVFQHVPVDDMGNLYEECSFYDEGAVSNGNKYYRLNKDIASGDYAGSIVPGLTSEQFTSWKNQGDVLGAYFGHWHTTGITGTWDGIELGMTYGCEFAKTGPYGVRVFTLHENDIENYDNEIYTYEGSVKKGNARFEIQVDEPYVEYDNFIAEFFGSIKNVFDFIIRAITGLLS